MKTRDRGRKVKDDRLGRETATLANLQLHGTHNLHCNVLHELLCSPERVKCVCTVQVSCKLTSVGLSLLCLYSS